MWLAGFSAEFLHSQPKLNKKIRLRGLISANTEDQNCGLRSSKLLGCWSISVEQFAVGAEGHVTDC